MDNKHNEKWLLKTDKKPIDLWLLKEGMTQGALAKKLKVTQAHLSQVLNFKLPISAKFIAKLKKVIPHEIVEKHFNL